MLCAVSQTLQLEMIRGRLLIYFHLKVRTKNLFSGPEDILFLIILEKI